MKDLGCLRRKCRGGNLLLKESKSTRRSEKQFVSLIIILG
jgi:hypothetical protein